MQGALEEIYASIPSSKTDTSKWTWGDWASFLRANNNNDERHYWYYLVEICEALDDLDSIEVK